VLPPGNKPGIIVDRCVLALQQPGRPRVYFPETESIPHAGIRCPGLWCALMNQLSKLLPLGNVLVDSDARDKGAALDVAAALFSAASALAESKIRASLAAREQLGSTGLGQGVAIPHGRVRGIRHAMAAVVRLAKPVPFDAPDGKPVDLLVALLVPENATQEHLEVLSELAQMLSDRDMRNGLLQAPTAAALYARIAGWEPIRPAA
jgi:PTS system nitrogen regulatory IIA component